MFREESIIGLTQGMVIGAVAHVLSLCFRFDRKNDIARLMGVALIVSDVECALF